MEKELAEMNRLKVLELEFMLFLSKMDDSIFQKFHDALSDEDDVEYISHEL